MEYNYKICPACDFFCNTLERKSFCPKCGSHLLEKCKNCGETINFPYAKYCGFCGRAYKDNNPNNDLREIKPK